MLICVITQRWELSVETDLIFDFLKVVPPEDYYGHWN